MSRNQNLRGTMTAAALLGAAALAGCGKQGVLEQPAPLFGSRAKAAYDAQKAQEARDEAQRAAQRSGTGAPASDNGPVSKRDVQDPAQKLTPASSAPIAGATNLGGAPVQTRPLN